MVPLLILDLITRYLFLSLTFGTIEMASFSMAEAKGSGVEGGTSVVDQSTPLYDAPQYEASLRQ
jgi:hypothetical protein